MRAASEGGRVGRIGSWILAVALVPSTAAAIEFESFVEVDGEEDLYELFERGVLDDESLESLLDLHRTPLDLADAPPERLHALPNLSREDVDAIVAFRAENAITTPGVLADREVIDARKAEALTPFVQRPERARPPPSAELRLLAHALLDDPRPPATLVTARVRAFGHLELGLAGMLVRERIGRVMRDPLRDRWVADVPRLGVAIPRFYLSYERTRFAVVAGTYRIGFGQGLTFDSLGLARSEGFRGDLSFQRPRALTRRCRLSQGELDTAPCGGSAGKEYGAPDFAAQEGLRGLAVTLRGHERRWGALEGHLFASHQTHSLYQYQLRDRSMCPDPREGGALCRAPDVYAPSADPYGPAPRHAYRTLPRIFDLTTVGARAAYRRHRSRWGLTTYGALPRFRLDGAALDLQSWSRWPYGGAFGAAGIDASLGIGAWEIAGEVTRSLDSMPSGGGWGALLRAITSPGAGELDLSLRYYDSGFANPFGRPIAAPDTLDGLRARDELGARLRYAGWPGGGAVRFSTVQDFWRRPTLDVLRLRSLVRVDVDVAPAIRLGTWVERVDRDLFRSGRGQCFEGMESELASEAPLPCGGERYRVAGRVEIAPARQLRIGVEHQRSWVDDRAYARRFRRDASSWLSVSFRPWRAFSLQARARHVHLDLDDRARLEQSLRGVLDATLRYGTGQLVRVRYELLAWLDARTSSVERTPSPAHWFWLETAVRF